MRPLLIPVLAVTLIGGAAAAQDAAGPETGVFREADESLTCAGISEEAAALSVAMGDATPQGGWLSSLGGIARSGAAMLAPVTAVAMAGVDAVRQPGRDRDEAAQEQVQNRWYYLNGLHIGRGCRDQAPTPAVAQTPPRSPAIRPGVLPAPAGSER